MSTLETKKIEERKKKKKCVAWIIICLFVLSAPIVIEATNGFLAGILGKNFGKFEFDFNYINCCRRLLTEKIRLVLFGIYAMAALLTYLYESHMATPIIGTTSTVEVAHGIEIPVAVGNGQCGNARFQTDEEKKETYAEYIVGENAPVGGIVVEHKKEGNKEIIRYLPDPVHAIILAATRRGKTRRVLLTTIWLNIMAGVNMAITDCKQEIYLFTHPFAKAMGYREITFDLRNPELSMQYNYMQQIISFLKRGEISEATEKTWDLVSVLVGEPKGERIWNDGECSAIGAAIMIVAQDAPDECKNLTNVYYFLAYMCEPNPITGEIPMNMYMEKLTDSHPAKAAFQVARIAPYRTRSSFFTSALATLRLFSDWKIADMTNRSEYDLTTLDDEKTIIYIMVPDEKQTRYGLASLYIKQVYETLLDIAQKKGGELDYRFEFELDEFGNFPTIPAMGSMMSAGAGRKIFFRLVLQDYQQMKKYYPEDYKNIKSNADLTIYLGTTDSETLKELSEACDYYTVETCGANTSANDGKNKDGVNYSSSANMTSRLLLYPGDIKRIEKPDALVLFGTKYPAIMNLPDISEYRANADFGMGDKKHNRQLLVKRSAERKARNVIEPTLWGIWKEIVKEMMIQQKLMEQEEKLQKENKKVSLMD